MSVHNSSAGQVVDLVNLFGAVVQNLSQNRQALNQADTFNHNHGDNMVAIFETVTKALEQNQGAAPAVQLLQASKALAPNQSGSAQVYANGLAEAARQLQGQKQITPENAMTLVQALLGGGQGAAQGGDAAASLLGALLGGNAPSQPQEGAGDLLGALLGAGGGPETASTGQGPAGAELLEALFGNTDAQGQRQVDTTKLLQAGLNIGLTYLSAKQKGSSNAQALISALLQDSPLGQSPHRRQSGALIADTILSVLGAMSQKR